jgi:hypothetical protein
MGGGGGPTPTAVVLLCQNVKVLVDGGKVSVAVSVSGSDGAPDKVTVIRQDTGEVEHSE